MKKRARFLILVLIGYIVPLQAETLLDLKIRGFALSVEIADTPEARTQGLMFRKQLPADRGMLFVFPESDYHTMWMENTYIPLSVAFLDERGVILNIADMTPRTQREHRAAGRAKFALEVNQGWFAQHCIKTGERVRGLPGVKDN